MHKPKVVRAVHANRGQAIRYRPRMLAIIDAMVVEVEHHVIVTYRSDAPVVAMDASPVRAMREQFRKLAARWIKRFDDSAPKIAEAYLKGSFKATDSAVRQALKDAGWTVKFEMTPAVREAFEASLAENVGLIRSIPERYLQQVEGVVMRSYAVFTSSVPAPNL